jgi:diadenosine tetraphosphate (Ap4A) HIT family hydrolase
MKAGSVVIEPGSIPEQLLTDCHYLGSLATSAVLLNRNASLPWFILVPRTHLSDFLDLPDEQRQSVLVDCAAVSAFIKEGLGLDKVNFAGLGNIVAAMHLHIIGRHSSDACWPQPVWGNLPDGEAYTDKQLRNWQAQLVERFGLVPVSL